MDYEKAYKAVLETATKWIKDGCTDKEKICLENVFPELYESEDERIITRLILLLHRGGYLEEPDRTKVFAWLEKQKESLHISETCKENADSFTDDERIRKWLVDYFKAVDKSWIHRDISPEQILTYLERQKEPENVSATTMAPSCWEVEQKEQKPAGCADDVVEEAEEYASKVACGEYGAEVTEAYIAGVLSERNRGTEWSEFDKGVLKDAICATDTLGNDESFNKSNPNLAKAFRVAKDWLKSLPERLNLQPKQEWSEKDEANLDYLIDYCNSQENGQHPILVTSIARKISLWLYRLKSGEITIKRQANEGWSNDDEEHFDSVCSVLRSKLDEGNWKPLIDLLLRLKTAYCYQRACNEKDEKTIHLACEFIRHHATKIDSIGGIDCSELVERLKSLRPQPHKEIYQAAKHDLAIRFMNYLDENRPTGKMCLSNGECEDIDKAFEENDWAKIMRYMEKYSSFWKPSKEQMRVLSWAANGMVDKSIAAPEMRAVLRELYEHLKKLRVKEEPEYYQHFDPDC